MVTQPQQRFLWTLCHRESSHIPVSAPMGLYPQTSYITGMQGLGSTAMGADASSWGPNTHGGISGGECGPFDELLLPLLEVGRRHPRDGLGLYEIVVQPVPCKSLSLVTNKPGEFAHDLKYGLDLSPVLLRIISVTLKCVRGHWSPLHPLPPTSLPAVQTVYDLKGRSLMGEAQGLRFITSSYVNMENL